MHREPDGRGTALTPQVYAEADAQRATPASGCPKPDTAQSKEREECFEKVVEAMSPAAKANVGKPDPDCQSWELKYAHYHLHHVPVVPAETAEKRATEMQKLKGKKIVALDGKDALEVDCATTVGMRYAPRSHRGCGAGGCFGFGVGWVAVKPSACVQ